MVEGIPDSSTVHIELESEAESVALVRAMLAGVAEQLQLDRALLSPTPDGGPRYVKTKDARVGKLRRALLVQGVDLMGAGGMLSFAHTDADVERTIEAFDRALAALAREGAL